jgi:hypothetical protein
MGATIRIVGSYVCSAIAKPFSRIRALSRGSVDAAGARPKR